MKPEQSFIFQYRIWLIQFCSVQQPASAFKIAQSLIMSLENISSIDELIHNLSEQLNEIFQTNSNEEKTRQQVPKSFVNKLQEWKSELETRKLLHQKALCMLEAAKPMENGVCLIELLTDIIQAPNAILHYQLNSLLQRICDPAFFKVLEFIQSQPNTPPPKNPRKGSFEAMKPLNTSHKKCLFLVTNISAAFDLNFDNPYLDKANALLQDTLKIYPELTPIEFELSNQEDSEVQYEDAWSKKNCTMF